MNAIAASIIVEVLEQKLLDKEVFTAYEVTQASRALTTERVDHADVKDIVNNEFKTQQMGTVARMLCSLNDGRGSEAFVYYPNGKSASDHPLVGSVAVSNVSVNLDDSTDSDSTDNTDNTDSIDSNITAEGRINIPKSLLSSVTPTGGSYDISFNGSLHCRVPNKDGRVRISINAIGFVGNKAKFSIDKNTIVIESV